METLRIFLTSNSGYVSRREGLSLGWLAGAIAGVAAFFGMTNEAAAHNGDCPSGWLSCGATYCTSTQCSFPFADKWLSKHLCQQPGQACQQVGFDHACDCE